MNLEEMRKWIESAEMVDSNSDIDKCGNEDDEVIYERDGKLYQVNYCNGHISEKWGEKGYVRGEYEPVEVVMTTRMVEERTYAPKEYK